MPEPFNAAEAFKAADKRFEAENKSKSARSPEAAAHSTRIIQTRLSEDIKQRQSGFKNVTQILSGRGVSPEILVKIQSHAEHVATQQKQGTEKILSRLAGTHEAVPLGGATAEARRLEEERARLSKVGTEEGVFPAVSRESALNVDSETDASFLAELNDKMSAVEVSIKETEDGSPEMRRLVNERNSLNQQIKSVEERIKKQMN